MLWTLSTVLYCKTSIDRRVVQSFSTDAHSPTASSPRALPRFYYHTHHGNVMISYYISHHCWHRIFSKTKSSSKAIVTILNILSLSWSNNYHLIYATLLRFHTLIETALHWNHILPHSRFDERKTSESFWWVCFLSINLNDAQSSTNASCFCCFQFTTGRRLTSFTFISLIICVCRVCALKK